MHSAKTCHTESKINVPVTYQNSMQIHKKPTKKLAGKPENQFKIYSKTPGNGTQLKPATI